MEQLSVPVGTTATKSRLMIKKLVLENFKSYAGKREIGPFHKSFSSIVGPNGSGKSNVIDSLLFVFGYRATAIRLKKISELIHRSSSLPDLTHCSVTVHFQSILDKGGDDEFDIIPDSIFSVSRTANSSNESFYSINDHRVTYAQVQATLKAHAIDLDNNRFLILQGEVEQISMMKPKATTPHETGMLEYLEDIVGTSKYVATINELAQQLEVLNEERTQAGARLKLVEKEREGLEAAKDEAIEFQRTNFSAHRHKVMLLQCQHHDAAASQAEVLQEIAQLEKRREAELTKLDAFKKTMSKLEAEAKHAKAEYDNTSKAMQRAKAEFAVFERKDVNLTESIKHRHTSIKKARSKLNKIIAQSAELDESLVTDQRQLPEMIEMLSTLEAQHLELDNSIQSMYERLKKVMEPLKEQLEAEQQRLAPMKTVVNAKQSVLAAVESEISILESKYVQAEEQRKVFEEQLSELSEQVASNVAALNEAQERVRNLLSELQQSAAEFSVLTTSEDALQKKRDGLIESIEENKTTLNTAKSTSPSSNVMQALTMAKNEASKASPLKGFIGRLGDLGIISSKYDIAISTACPALNDYVVESEATARACIELLKKKSLGRARFIIMEKISYIRKELDATFDTPSGSQRLFDLVEKLDPELDLAFFFALKNTIVCDSMETAMQIGYGHQKRHRVVTLDGKVIESSGAMSGGGQQQIKGAMKSSWKEKSKQSSIQSTTVSEEHIKSQETELSEVSLKLKAIQCQRQEISTTQRERQKTMSNCEHIVNKIQLKVQELEAKRSSLLGRITLLNTDMNAADTASKKKLLVKKVGAQKEVDTAAESCASFEKNIEAIEKQMLMKGGQKLRDQQQKINELQEKCEELRNAISKAQLNSETGAARQTKLKTDQTQIEYNIETLQQELKHFHQEQKELEDDATEAQKAYIDAQKLCDDCQRQVCSIDRQKEQEESAVEPIREVEADLAMKIDELKIGNANRNAKEATLRSQLQSAILDLLKEQQELGESEDKEIKNVLVSPSEQSRNSAESMQIDNEAEELRTKASKRKGQSKRNPRTAREASSVNIPSTTWQAVFSAEQITQLGLLSHQAIPVTDRKKLIAEIKVLETRAEAMTPNLRAIGEYKRKARECTDRYAACEQIGTRYDSVRSEYDGLRKRRLDEFMAAFSLITLKLKEMYQMLTLGGDAELELVDTLDPFTEGVVFSVRPPKKSWKSIAHLSGGEKTLSSLSLVFALHHFRPTPLYVMDEIDAALDYRNVSIVAHYIATRTRNNAQFIIISLRNHMFECADRLVGIYKVNDMTRSVAIDPKRFNVPNGDNVKGHKKLVEENKKDAEKLLL